MSGGPNLFKATYETWGNVVIQQYPNVMKEYPPTEQILNTRYVQMASGRINVSEQAPAEKISYSANKGMSEIIGKRNYSINFALGSATILPASFDTLNNIVNDLVTSNTSVIIHGHTDNTGTPQGNIMLSEARANSVRRYLMEKGGTAVPGSRVRVVAHGQEDPLADNSTDAGRAKNRRVEIVIGR
jgi:outer membrane protein OmpA-like peptidoglycan-associated protein